MLICVWRLPLTEDEVRQEEGFKKSTDETAKARHLAKRLAEGRRVEDVALENDCPAAVTVTFRLRRGLTFSDGVPLTSADFVFTHDLVAHPLVDAGPWRAGTTDKLKSVVRARCPHRGVCIQSALLRRV